VTITISLEKEPLGTGVYTTCIIIVKAIWLAQW